MTKIRLQKTKVLTTHGLRDGYRPLNNHALFEHCTEGAVSITEEYYEDKGIEYLLRIHGIDIIEIIENDN